jgi:hypothetical protein
MKIGSLAGTQKIDPVSCPSCGHLFEQYSGTPGGTVPKAEHAQNVLLLMVCEKCETAVARNGACLLALTKEQELQLPAVAQANIAQARNLVQAQKRMSPERH